MKMKKISKKIYRTFIFIIGFILSPLSWWNDLIINIPISYLFALPFGMINRNLFIPLLILGYWLTNIMGIIMMHYGSKELFKKNKNPKILRYELIKMLVVTTMYTVLIAILVLNGILKFPTEYLRKNG
jgi:hypothetical protein